MVKKGTFQFHVCIACNHPEIEKIDRLLIAKQRRNAVTTDVLSHKQIAAMLTPPLKLHNIQMHHRYHYQECIACGSFLPLHGPLGAFYKSKKSNSGFMGQCKTCHGNYYNQPVEEEKHDHGTTPAHLVKEYSRDNWLTVHKAIQSYQKVSAAPAGSDHHRGNVGHKQSRGGRVCGISDLAGDVEIK